MDAFSELTELVTDLHREIAELKRRLRNRKRTGKVVEVDAKKGVARVELTEKAAGGKPYKTGWIPWREQSMGKIKTHYPPAVGEQVTVVSENGDLTDSEIDTSVPSNANPRPHDKEDEIVRTVGGFREHVDATGNIQTTGKDVTITAVGKGHLA